MVLFREDQEVVTSLDFIQMTYLSKLIRPQTETAYSNAKEFIDGVSVLAEEATLEAMLNNLHDDYLSIYEYLVNHSMAINTEKTQLMVIDPPKDNSNIQLTLNNCKINNQKTMKILGINLSCDLTFDNHLWKGSKMC